MSNTEGLPIHVRHGRKESDSIPDEEVRFTPDEGQSDEGVPTHKDTSQHKGSQVVHAPIRSLATAAAAVAARQVEVDVYEGHPPIIKFPSAKFSCDESIKLGGPYPVIADPFASIEAKQVEFEGYEVIKVPSEKFSCDENVKLDGPYPAIAQRLKVRSGKFNIEECIKLPGPYPIGQRLKVRSGKFNIEECIKLPGPYPIGQRLKVRSRKFNIEECIKLAGPYPLGQRFKVRSGRFSSEECIKLAGPYPNNTKPIALHEPRSTSGWCY